MTGYDSVRRDVHRAVDRAVSVQPDVETFPDGSIKFTPPFTKDQADYRRPSDRDFDENHDRCTDCVHYIEGGGCHFVRGEIDEWAYCREYYADYGVFGKEQGLGVEINAELVGSRFRFEMEDAERFADEIERRLKEHVRAWKQQQGFNAPQPARFDPGDTLGYAVFDPATNGFVKSGFTGQTVFESLPSAEEVAGPGTFVVRAEVEELL